MMFLVHPLVSIERLSDSRSNCDTVRIGSVIGTPGALEGRHVHKHKVTKTNLLDLGSSHRVATDQCCQESGLAC